MGTNILPGQALVGGQANGQLNQYYGLADTTVTTVTAAALTVLSSVYTIPAGEASAASAYELCCGGSGTWGSTQQALTMDAKLNANSIHSGRQIQAATFAASAPFIWSACLKIVCADGISLWQASWTSTMNATTNPITSGFINFGDSSPSAVTAAVSSAITVEMLAQWASTTGAPTITNNWTTFRKVS